MYLGLVSGYLLVNSAGGRFLMLVGVDGKFLTSFLYFMTCSLTIVHCLMFIDSGVCSSWCFCNIVVFRNEPFNQVDCRGKSVNTTLLVKSIPATVTAL